MRVRDVYIPYLLEALEYSYARRQSSNDRMMIVTVILKLFRKVLIWTIGIMPHQVRGFRNDGLTHRSDAQSPEC